MADLTTTTTEKKPTVQEQFEARSAQNQAGITNAYDSGIAAQKQSLLDAYNANTAAQQEAGQTVRQTYESLNNDLAVQNARNMNNVNQSADARNMNRQAGSQAALSLGNARAAALGNLAYQQQQALAENQRQQDLAKSQYQARVQAALADKDYKQAAALLDSYNNENTWRDQQAAILASYGNFDPYKDLYGDETATAMQKVWQAQNPDVAYRTGAITPDQYRQLTGRWPEGYSPYSGGGGGGWYTGYVPDGADNGTATRVQNAAARVTGVVQGALRSLGGGRGAVYTPTAINSREKY